jgi:hypothetical protein
MKCSEMFRIEHNSKLKLDKIDPNFKGKHADKDSAEAETTEHVDEMRELQYLLYAEGKRSL